MTRTPRLVVIALGLAVVLGLTVPVTADQVPVNIVYPINGDTYPKVDPMPGKISSAYVSFSFSTTCGSNGQVEWGVDGDIHGEAKFYDEYSTQYVYKLPAGIHVFWVRSTCGENKVEFKVGA